MIMGHRPTGRTGRTVCLLQCAAEIIVGVCLENYRLRVSSVVKMII